MDAPPTETEEDPRRKRAFILGGVVLVAALAWNWDGWFGDGEGHGITVEVGDTEEAADIVERELSEIGRGEQGAEIAARIRAAGGDEAEAETASRAAPDSAAQGEARSEDTAPARTAGTGDAETEEEAEAGLLM